MDWQRVLRLAGPILAMGLVVPLVWIGLTLSLAEEDLAGHGDGLVARVTLVDGTQVLGPHERVWSAEVTEVLRANASTNVTDGQRIELLVETDTRAGRWALDAGEVGVDVVLLPSVRTDPATGNTTWTGWLVVDASKGERWASQSIVVHNAVRSMVPSLLGAVLVGYGLGLPRYLQPRRLLFAVPAVLAGLVLALFLGALVASVHGPNAIYPAARAGFAKPGGLAYLLVVLGVGSSALRNPGLRLDGGHAALVAGLGAWLGLPLALLLGSSRVASSSFAPGNTLVLLSIFAAIGVMGLAAARYLTMATPRRVTAALAVLPGLVVVASDGPYVGLSLPLLVLGVAIARELVEDG